MSEKKKKEKLDHPETNFLPPLKMFLAFPERDTERDEKAEKQEASDEKNIERLIEKLSEKDE